MFGLDQDLSQAYKLHCKSLKLLNSVECTELGWDTPNPQGEYGTLAIDLVREGISPLSVILTIHFAGYRPGGYPTQRGEPAPPPFLPSTFQRGLPTFAADFWICYRLLPSTFQRGLPTFAADFWICYRLLPSTFQRGLPTCRAIEPARPLSMGKKPPLSTGCYRLLLQTSGFATDLLPTCYRLFPLKSTMLQCYRLFHILKEKKKILF